MKAGILALQGGFRPHVEALSALGADAFEVRLPRDLAGADALVLPGGESTTMSLLLGSSGLEAPVGDLLADAGGLGVSLAVVTVIARPGGRIDTTFWTLWMYLNVYSDSSNASWRIWTV